MLAHIPPLSGYTPTYSQPINTDSVNPPKTLLQEPTEKGGDKMQTTQDTGDQGGVTDTECLIVGCGPSGASLACFLASYG